MNFRESIVCLFLMLFSLTSSSLWAGDQNYTTDKKPPSAPKMTSKTRGFFEDQFNKLIEYDAKNAKKKKARRDLKYNVNNYSFQTIAKRAFELPKGKVIVIMQGSKTCGYCTMEVQAIEEIKQDASQSPFQFYVHSSWDTPSVMSNKYRKFKEVDGYIKDPAKIFGYHLYEQFKKNRGIPKTIVYDTSGVVLGIIQGFMPPEKFKKKLLGIVGVQAKKETYFQPSMQAPF